MFISPCFQIIYPRAANIPIENSPTEPVTMAVHIYSPSKVDPFVDSFDPLTKIHLQKKCLVVFRD